MDQRIREQEIMDQPGLDESVHQRALAGLRRVNWWSRTAALLWAEMQRVPTLGGAERLRVLDLACGGGDVAIRLAERALHSGVEAVIHGWDKSQTAVEIATTNARRGERLNVEFFVRDALADPVSEPYDVVYCTLFLHHLDSTDAVRLLQRMAGAARHAVLVDDLRRTALGYWLAWAGCRLLSCSKVVHADGPQSVRAAFTEGEVRSLAVEAGLQNVSLRRHWPQRFLLTWMPF